MRGGNYDIVRLLRYLSRQPPYNACGDKKWKRVFIKIAPYTSLSLCVLMALCGLLSRGLPLGNFEWHLAIMAALMVLLLLFVARKVKKIRRNPTIPLMMAHAVPLWGLFVIIVFFILKVSFVESCKRDGWNVSKIVDSKITEKKVVLAEKMNSMIDRVAKQRVYVRSSMDEIQKHIDESEKKMTASLETLAKIDAEKELLLKEWQEARDRFSSNKPKNKQPAKAQEEPPTETQEPDLEN